MAKNNNKYSDLLNEIVFNKNLEASLSFNSLSQKKYKGNYGLKKESFCIKTDALAKELNKDKGNYSVISFENVFVASPKMLSYLINHISRELKKYLGSIASTDTVLIVALGNQHISADSLGPHVLKNIITTRGVGDFGLFNDKPNVCTFSASVFGVTGVESYEVITSLVKEINPTKLILIDTLCANNYFRLGTSFQINNASIVPGGGINNAQKKLSKNTLGTDVVAIGVPLVVYANSLVQNAVDETLAQIYDKIDFENKTSNNNNQAKSSISTSKISDFDERIRKIRYFKNNVNFFADKLDKFDFGNLIVTLKDIEESVALCGKIVGYALNKSICGFSIDQQNKVLNRV